MNKDSKILIIAKNDGDLADWTGTQTLGLIRKLHISKSEI